MHPPSTVTFPLLPEELPYPATKFCSFKVFVGKKGRELQRQLDGGK